jgi:hypothetical protein
LVYIIDIDNTICKTVGSDYVNSIPYHDKIEKINQLFDSGNTVIYWTARGMKSGTDHTTLTTQQLQSWGCRYSELRMFKPSYDVWVDDKAINEMDFFK